MPPQHAGERDKASNAPLLAVLPGDCIDNPRPPAFDRYVRRCTKRSLARVLNRDHGSGT